mgnify:CR=1 FL=1
MVRSLFSSWRADLQTYRGDWTAQGFWALVVHRFGTWRYGVRPVLLRKVLSLFYKVAFKGIQIFCGMEIPCEAQVGRGTRIDHFGGIIVSGYARIGDHCILRQGVTIGLKCESEPVAPWIGDRVSIGSGAAILGDVRIGDGAAIGANAVVLSDVPAGCIAVGVPARIRPGKRKPSWISTSSS